MKRGKELPKKNTTSGYGKKGLRIQSPLGSVDVGWVGGWVGTNPGQKKGLLTMCVVLVDVGLVGVG